MTQPTAMELEKLGRDAATRVAGADAIKGVEVVPGEDWSDQPIYIFSFLVDHALVNQRIGLLRIRLGQQLRDALIARDDDHYPMIRILDQTDWDKRAIVGAVRA